MKLRRPSPAMVVALIALVMSMTGGAIAAVNYAKNSGKDRVIVYPNVRLQRKSA